MCVCVCVCVNACVCVNGCVCVCVCVCEGMCVCECDACNDDGVVSVLAALLSATTADGEAGGGHCRLPEEHHPFSRLPHLLCAESLCRYVLSLSRCVDTLGMESVPAGMGSKLAGMQGVYAKYIL